LSIGLAEVGERTIAAGSGPLSRTQSRKSGRISLRLI